MDKKKIQEAYDGIGKAGWDGFTTVVDAIKAAVEPLEEKFKEFEKKHEGSYFHWYPYPPAGPVERPKPKYCCAWFEDRVSSKGTLKRHYEPDIPILLGSVWTFHGEWINNCPNCGTKLAR